MDMTPESGLKFAKPELSATAKKRREKQDAQNERAAREIVRKRDLGKCRIPGCKERSEHLHHIVFRSRSRGLRWDPRNLCSLCADHHALVHGGIITISGDADQELEIRGDVDRLRFRL